MNSITTISSEKKESLRQFFLDLWHYRDLFRAFLERDIQLRYKQTFLGVLWVILVPLMTAGALTMVLGKFASLNIGRVPYILYFLCAQVPWVCFSQALSGAAGSMEANSGLISKVYFPRIVVPFASIVGTIPDFLIGFTIINGVALYLKEWTILFLILMPPLLMMQLLASAGLGLFLTALNAQYRDVKYIVPVLIQLGFLVTVIYPIPQLPCWAQYLSVFNPMAGIITTYRWTFGGNAPELFLIVGNIIACSAYGIVGVLFFRSREMKFVDIL